MAPSGVSIFADNRTPATAAGLASSKNLLQQHPQQGSQAGESAAAADAVHRQQQPLQDEYKYVK